MTTEPVRTVLIPIALLAFAAAAQAFVDGADTRGIITAVLGVLVVVAQELARGKVTPTASTSGARGEASTGLVGYPTGRPDRDDEAGYGLVEVALFLLILVIAFAIAVRYL